MAGGFPLKVNGVDIRTSEALYQACRFPHNPEVQRLIIEQRSPMSAKMKSKPYRDNTRPDWHRVRVRIMRWCLRVKLAQNWEKFRDALLETGDLPIVEHSRRDDFWGAKPIDEQTLVGVNALGRLLMELRERIKQEPEPSVSLSPVKPLAIPDFLLDEQGIEPIYFYAEPDALSSEGTITPVAEIVHEPQADMNDSVRGVVVGTIDRNDNRIDLNMASSEDLKTLQGVGPQRAKDIIARREQRGFINTEEIVSILGSNVYNKLKHQIKVDGGHNKEVPNNTTDAFAGNNQLPLALRDSERSNSL